MNPADRGILANRGAQEHPIRPRQSESVERDQQADQPVKQNPATPERTCSLRP